MEIIQSEALKIKLGWLVKIRYLNCLGAILLAFLAYSIRFIDRPSFYLIVFVVSIVLIINFLTQRIFQSNQRPLSDLTIFFQLLIDLMALTQILIIAGRPAVPLHSLYMVLAALGALLLVRKTSFIYFILLFLGLVLTQFISFDPASLLNASHARDVFLRLAIFHLPLVVIWGIANSLSRYLEVISEKMTNLELQTEKMDRLRAVGALTAGISHEFASPLNIVKLRLNRLSKEIEKNANLDEALAGIARCEDAVKALNSAQIDHRDVQSEWVSLAQDLDQIIESMRSDGVEIKNLIDKNFKLFVPRLNFSTIILNLLDNAIDAKSSCVAITSNLTKDKFEIVINDNGEGIKQAVEKEIGNPFYTTKVEGTGLGIYSAKIFMESIGGNLIIKNNNRGVSVLLIFPRRLLEGQIGE